MAQIRARIETLIASYLMHKEPSTSTYYNGNLVVERSIHQKCLEYGTKTFHDYGYNKRSTSCTPSQA